MPPHRWISLGICILLLSASAQAGWLIEPLITLGGGTWNTERESTTKINKINGASYGGGAGIRIGLGAGVGIVGLQIDQNSLTWKYNQATDYSGDDSWKDVSGTQTTTALFLGLRTNSRNLLGYFSYAPLVALALSADPDPTELTPSYSGSAMGLGVAYRFKQHFSMGFEYRTVAFNKWTNSSGSYALPADSGGTTYKQINHTQYLFLVSFPFEIGR